MIVKIRYATKNNEPIIETVKIDEHINLVVGTENSLSSKYLASIAGKTIDQSDTYWDYYNLPIDDDVKEITEKEFNKLKKDNESKIKAELDEINNEYEYIIKSNYLQLLSDKIPEASAKLISGYNESKEV